MLSGAGYFCSGKMRSPGVLPLFHQNEGVVRPEVLRRLPGGARQGTACRTTLHRGCAVTVQAVLAWVAC